MIVSSVLLAIAFTAAVVAALKISVLERPRSGEDGTDDLFAIGKASAFQNAPLGHGFDGSAGDVLAEAALEVLGDDRAFGLVALVQEGDAERIADILEDHVVLGPADHRARRHHRGDVAGD